jgi:hypothetical protein
MKSNAAAEKSTERPQPSPDIDSTKFFQAIIERRISDAEKELDGIRTTVPGTEAAKGYLKALEGLLLTSKSTDDKYLYLSKGEMTATKLKTLRKEFAQQNTNPLHSDYDRGYFQALESYMKKLEREGPPREASTPQSS